MADSKSEATRTKGMSVFKTFKIDSVSISSFASDMAAREGTGSAAEANSSEPDMVGDDDTGSGELNPRIPRASDPFQGFSQLKP